MMRAVIQSLHRGHEDIENWNATYFGVSSDH